MIISIFSEKPTPYIWQIAAPLQKMITGEEAF
jgi:hypothetical protein